MSTLASHVTYTLAEDRCEENTMIVVMSPYHRRNLREQYSVIQECLLSCLPGDSPVVTVSSMNFCKYISVCGTTEFNSLSLPCFLPESFDTDMFIENRQYRLVLHKAKVVFKKDSIQFGVHEYYSNIEILSQNLLQLLEA
jgi:hypothetical protein